MNEDQKSNLRKAVEALRANENKATTSMRNAAGGRCCLCVMSEVAEDMQGLERGSLELDDALPVSSLSEFYGLPNSAKAGGFSFRLRHGEAHLSVTELNDGSLTKRSLTHAEIADLIEQQYLTQSE
jgi:hypothetical protein